MKTLASVGGRRDRLPLMAARRGKVRRRTRFLVFAVLADPNFGIRCRPSIRRACGRSEPSAPEGARAPLKKRSHPEPQARTSHTRWVTALCLWRSRALARPQAVDIRLSGRSRTPRFELRRLVPDLHTGAKATAQPIPAFHCWPTRMGH